VSRAKPKSIRRDNVTLDRVYRRLLALEKSLGDQLAINRIAIESTRELLKSIVYNSKESREDNLATLPSIREAILDTTQMMHLYQTHFDDLAKNFGAGAISRVTAMPHPREAMSTYGKVVQQFADNAAMASHPPKDGFRCADTRKPEGVPEMTQWKSSHAPFDIAFSPSAPCSFAHLHRPGIVCAICGHLEMRAPA